MSVQILIGDVRDRLKSLPDESVHCVVTSPPYWGLRDYGTAQWEGGDQACDHRESSPSRTAASVASSGLEGGKASIHLSHQFKRNCLRCGAIRVDLQLGLERTLGEHVSTMVEVFREVRRVLRKDGTLWLNYGDSYATSMNGRSAADTKAAGNDDRTFRDKPFSTVGNGLKPKDLCGIPWRVAFGLQEDGWYLRQDIIWSKPNPMPESIRDRCTKAHEYLFLLAKSERYYFDASAIAEDSIKGDSGSRFDVGKTAKHQLDRMQVERPQRARAFEIARNHGLTEEHISAIRSCGVTDVGKARITQNGTGKNLAAVQALADHAKTILKGYYREFLTGDDGKRNRRSVWIVPTEPFSDAHFATFPPALIEPCIKAGCPAGGTVLDPFGGAGTTGLVADRLRRNAILIELNPEYAAMARKRIDGDGPLFAGTEHELPYDGQQDLSRGLDAAYEAIRERKAAGGEGWVPK